MSLMPPNVHHLPRHQTILIQFNHRCHGYQNPTSPTAPNNTDSYHRCHQTSHHLQLRTILIIIACCHQTYISHLQLQAAILIKILVAAIKSRYATKSTVSPTATDNTDNHHRCHQTYITYNSRQYRYYGVATRTIHDTAVIQLHTTLIYCYKNTLESYTVLMPKALSEP